MIAVGVDGDVDGGVRTVDRALRVGFIIVLLKTEKVKSESASI